MQERIVLPIAIAVAVASVLGIATLSFSSMPGTAIATSTDPALDSSASTSTAASTGITRTFYLFNAELDQVNETKLGFSGDIYSLQTMVVRQGDTVKINFFNTEPQANERHSFTLPTFSINKALAGGEHTTISFVADKAGIFEYHCIFHQPEMRGQLVVLP
jgi:plastocyanin